MRHLRGDRARGRRPPRLPRPVGRLHAAARATDAARRRRNGRLRVLGVGRLVAKKGFDVLVDACAVLRERGVPFEALIVGQDDREGDALRAADRRARAATPCALPGADGPGRAAARVPPRGRAVHALPAAATTTATASRTCSSRRWPPARRWSRPPVSGIPELVERRGQRAARPARGPRGAGRRAAAPARRPGARRGGSPRRAARPSRSASTATRLARGLADAVPGGGERVSALAAVRPRPVLCVNEHEHRDRALAEAVAAGPLHASRARRASSASSPTGCTPTCPPTRSGGSTGSSSTTGSTSRTRSGPAATGASSTRGSGSSRASSLQVAAGPRPQRRHRPPDPELDLRLAAAARGRRPRSRRRSCDEPREQARHVRANLTPERNHRTLELYALLIAALALPGLDARPAEFAVAELHRNLLTRLPARRRAPRALDALPPDRPALVRGRARELPPLRRRAARRVRRAALARPATSRCTCRAPGRHDPRALRQRQRRLPRAARPGRASCSSAAELRRAAERPRELPGRRLLRPARAATALPDLRLRPARRRRPRPLRPAEHRGVGRRPPAGARPRPLHLRRGRAEPAPLVPRHRRPQHGHGRRLRPDAVRARALVAPDAPRAASSAAPARAGLDVLAGEVRSPVYEAVHRRA